MSACTCLFSLPVVHTIPLKPTSQLVKQFELIWEHWFSSRQWPHVSLHPIPYDPLIHSAEINIIFVFFLSFYAHIEARFVFNNTITNPTLNVQMCLSKSFMVLEVICNHVWYTKVISMLSPQIATRSFINEGCMCNLFRFWISHLCRQFAYMLPVWTVRTLNVVRDLIRVSRTIYTSTPDSISYNVKRFPLYESCGYFWRE